MENFFTRFFLCFFPRCCCCCYCMGWLNFQRFHPVMILDIISSFACHPGLNLSFFCDLYAETKWFSCSCCRKITSAIFVMDLKMLATDENLCNEKTKWEMEKQQKRQIVSNTERKWHIFFGRSYDSGNELLAMIAVSRANRLDGWRSHVFIHRWTQCQDGVRQTLVNRCLLFFDQRKVD